METKKRQPIVEMPSAHPCSETGSLSCIVVDGDCQPRQKAKGASLAKRLGVAVCTPEEHNASAPDALVLHFTSKGIALEQGKLSLLHDFTDMLARTKPGRLNQELLVRAAKVKHADHAPVAFDATAGLGQDSFLLAAAGFETYLFEQDPIIATLLEDALERGLQDARLMPILNRMHLLPENSISGMPAHASLQPDVIYLDPMFPQRKKSAQVKKKFQLIHQLERPCSDAKELLDAALEVHPRKIIIKRPLKGPHLAGRKPSYTLKGKMIRYDCLVFA